MTKNGVKRKAEIITNALAIVRCRELDVKGCVAVLAELALL
jgi:hypothetical protein